MYEIDPFWAGAREHGARLDLPRLAEACGGWRALVDGGEEALRGAGVPAAQARAWMRTPPGRSRGQPITLADPRYPERLRQIDRPPPVLCVEGDPGCLAMPAVAVVGTRRCTRYGSGVARHLGSALAAAGVAVVSGMARGIDSHAHRAALAVGRTVAVFGHGLSHTAPPSNARLREQIVASGGAVLSSWEDEHEPRRWTFPARNRWIAGLSQVVVVVEAPPRSGSLITAQAALEQGRDVWAVPGPIGVSASRGCLELLAQGAGVVVDVDDLVARLSGCRPTPREAWLDALFAGATLDDVSRSTGWSVAELLARLSRMELRGEVVRLPGQRYAPGGSPR